MRYRSVDSGAVRAQLALEPLELDTLVLDTVRSLQPSLRRRLRVEAPPRGQCPELEGDVQKLMQLTRGLLLDAIGSSRGEPRAIRVRTGTSDSRKPMGSEVKEGHATEGADLCYLEVTWERAAQGVAAGSLGSQAVLAMVSPRADSGLAAAWQTVVQHHGAVQYAMDSANDTRVTLLLPR